MNEAMSIITGSGASGSLTADFRALAEYRSHSGEPKYAPVKVMVWLAKVILGQSGGSNKDIPLFELCHLVHAINCLDDGSEAPSRRLKFFFETEHALPHIYCNWFLDMRDNLNENIQIHEKGIELNYPDHNFSINYGRMPRLAALYEFFSGMDDFSFYAHFNEIIDPLGAQDKEGRVSALRQIQDTANKLSSEFRKYRRKHLPRPQHDEAFKKLIDFLKNRSRSGRIEMDDEAVLDFWQANSPFDEFRLYRSVFDKFIELKKSLEEMETSRGLDQAVRIGTDRDENEVELRDDTASISDINTWQSPLSIFDEEPANRIKFFKQKTERKPIENLMTAGPYASMLPVAFLRLEAFGAIQAGITTDLQVKRGREAIGVRITCKDAITYPEILEEYEKILLHIKQLQLATLHAINQNNGPDHNDKNGNVLNLFKKSPQSDFEIARETGTPEEFDDHRLIETAETAEKAFKRLTRIGFNDDFIDDGENREGFYTGAGALIEIEKLLKVFIKQMSGPDYGRDKLEKVFQQDKNEFSSQFRTIYGVQ